MSASPVVTCDETARKHTDQFVLDTIATILGASAEWSSEMLEWIADAVAESGRPHPGDQPADVLAMYRRAADQLSIQHDGPEPEPSTVYVVVFFPATEHGSSVGGHEWRPSLDEARAEYDRWVAASKAEGGSSIVRLIEWDTDFDANLQREQITDELVASPTDLESDAPALRQYVPTDAQFPPTGGADDIDH
jgi:hypothetical protein